MGSPFSNYRRTIQFGGGLLRKFVRSGKSDNKKKTTKRTERNKIIFENIYHIIFRVPEMIQKLGI